MRLNRRGESLVELVVAMALFAVVVPSLYFALESAMRINLYSDTKSDLTYLAQSELETINALSSFGPVVEILTCTDTDIIGLPWCEIVYSTEDYVYFSKELDGIQYDIRSTLDTSGTINSILLSVFYTSKPNEKVDLELYIDFGDS